MHDAPRSAPGLPRALACSLLLALPSACSLRRMAIDGIAEALANSGDVFASDDDPELVRAALPFGLKTLEALIVEMPDDPDLLLAACRGFTQFSGAFVEGDADLLAFDDYEAASALRERALKLYLRARDYGLRGLEIARPGVAEELRVHPAQAAAALGADEVELLYWTGAAWGSAIALGLDRPGLVADVDAARAMLARVLELDESFGDGSIHESMITIESLPEMMGGSPARAREHFERAVELTRGESALPFVILAENASIAAQDRAEFQRLLERALAVDPDAAPSLRLSNILAQRKARHLLAVSDELFLEPLEPIE